MHFKLFMMDLLVKGMLLLVVLSLTSGASFPKKALDLQTNEILDKTPVQPAKSRPCRCMPEMFEVMASDVVAYSAPGKEPGVSVVTMSFSYDFKSNRFALNEATVMDKTLNMTIIGLKEKGALYAVDWLKKSCQKVPFEASTFARCLPEDAHYFNKMYFGMGKNKVVGDVWTFPVKKAGSDFSVSATFAQPDCVPLSEMAFGVSQGVHTVTTVGFFNATTGIKRQDLFDPPTFCDKVSMTYTSSEQRPSFFSKLRR